LIIRKNEFQNIINAVEKQGWDYVSVVDGNIGSMEIFCHTPAELYFSFFVNSEEEFLEFEFNVEEHVNKCVIKWIDTFGLYSIGTPDLPSLVTFVDDTRWIENEIKEMQDCVRDFIRAEKQEQAR